jgi:hypothetical protein
MDLEFTGEVVFWRGPAPWYFVPVPEEDSVDLVALCAQLSYGWGCIPVDVRIGATTYYTSLFPKDGGYLLPIKAAIRKAERIELGDVVAISLTTVR